MFDYKKILLETGIDLDNPQDILCLLQSHVEYLSTHNKNYTREQWRRILDIAAIINNMEV